MRVELPRFSKLWLGPIHGQRGPALVTAALAHTAQALKCRAATYLPESGESSKT